LNKGRVHFVVVFNLTRFARDKYDHFALRSHLQSRGKPLTSQAIGMLLRNQWYARIVDVPEYAVRAKCGDFEPLISVELF